MTELERRLRAAMQGTAESPPAGLIEAVRRRHRRHLRRAGTGYVAVAAAVGIAAVPLVRAQQPGQPGRSSGPGGQHVSPAPAASPVAAAGTVLAGCGSANVGRAASSGLSPDWRAGAGKAGPLWFLNVGGNGPVSGTGNTRRTGQAGPKPSLYVTAVVITGVRPGSAIVVRVAPADRGYLRFLYGPGDALNAGNTDTMSSGESAVTFVMCPLDGNPASSEPITSYYGGMLVSGGRCVPVDVTPPGRAQPIKINLGACH